MTPKQALKFLIKEHVKQLLVAEEYTMSGYGPQAAADDRWPDGALKRPPPRPQVPQSSNHEVYPATSIGRAAQEQRASVAPKTVPASDRAGAGGRSDADRAEAEKVARAKSEQDEKNKSDDSIIDKIIKGYNENKRGLEEEAKEELAQVSPDRKKIKAAALKKAEEGYFEREKAKQERWEYNQAFDRENGTSIGGY